MAPGSRQIRLRVLAHKNQADAPEEEHARANARAAAVGEFFVGALAVAFILSDLRYFSLQAYWYLQSGEWTPHSICRQDGIGLKNLATTTEKNVYKSGY